MAEYLKYTIKMGKSCTLICTGMDYTTTTIVKAMLPQSKLSMKMKQANTNTTSKILMYKGNYIPNEGTPNRRI